VGQTLHTTAPEVYRALVEATAFGAFTIIRRFEEYGVKVREVINCGGIADKNPFIMQVYADVCNRPMKISRSAQTCALGAAMFGAVVGGAYEDVEAAAESMTGVKSQVYRPASFAAKIYAQLYTLYRRLHDSFGGVNDAAAMGGIMKELIRIRDHARQ
jgi:L-ribulokinase